MKEMVKAVAFGVRPERDRLVLFPMLYKAKRYAARVASEQRQAVAVERLEATKELTWRGGKMWLDDKPIGRSNYLQAYREEFNAAKPQIVATVPPIDIK